MPFLSPTTVVCTIPSTFSTGFVGTILNTAQSLGNNANQGTDNPLGQAAPLGADTAAAVAGGMAAAGIVGGQCPSDVTYASGIAGSGDGVSQSCMYSEEMNAITGNNTVGQGPEGLGCDNPCDPAGGGGGDCGYIGFANTSGLNGVADLSDPTDFAYTDNADCL